MLPCPVQSPCRITQHYPDRPEFYGPLGLKAHGGLDLTGPKKGVSVGVFTPVEGKVIKAGPDGSFGLCVRVMTAPNWKGEQREVVLAHLKSIFVAKGDLVPELDLIGMMGKTGLADGVHLHWGHRLWKNGKLLNADNGYKGYLPFGTPEDPEAFVIFWGDPEELGLVTYPFH